MGKIRNTKRVWRLFQRHQADTWCQTPQTIHLSAAKHFFLIPREQYLVMGVPVTPICFSAFVILYSSLPVPTYTEQPYKQFPSFWHISFFIMLSICLLASFWHCFEARRYIAATMHTLPERLELFSPKVYHYTRHCHWIMKIFFSK